MAQPEALTSSKSWRTVRRIEGEKRAGTTQDDTSGGSGDFFDIKKPRLKFPQDLEKPTSQVQYAWADPYAHLGRIGYRRNTYQFRGANKEDNNIYGGQHMKKTAWLEEMRRRLIAEEHGISADVDDTSIAGTIDAWRLARDNKNKYYTGRQQKPDQQAWRLTPKNPSSTSSNPPKR